MKVGLDVSMKSLQLRGAIDMRLYLIHRWLMMYDAEVEFSARNIERLLPFILHIIGYEIRRKIGNKEFIGY